MAEHRVPVLNGSLHRYVDPARSNDPRIRELVAALSTLEVAPAPRAHFRAELRAQLVAVAPRLIEEGPADLVRHTPESLATAHVQPKRLHGLAIRLPRVHVGRTVRVATAALTVLVLLLSGAVWLSRSALPGDPLYGLKRASENTKLALTTGNVDRAKELLSFAGTRADEVSSLLGHASAAGTGPQADGGVSAHTASLVGSTLDSADDDVRQAATALGQQAVHSRSASSLAVMTGWAPGQLRHLQDIVARIPAGSLHTRAAASATLVGQALSRAKSLAADVGCGCLGSTGSDSLGPLPCTVCSPRTATPEHSTAPAPGTPTTSAKPGKTHHGQASPQVRGGSHGATSGSGTAPAPPASSTSPLPTVGVPNLPLLPTVPPLTVDSCGLNFTLGPLGGALGTCGVHLHI